LRPEPIYNGTKVPYSITEKILKKIIILIFFFISSSLSAQDRSFKGFTGHFPDISNFQILEDAVKDSIKHKYGSLREGIDLKNSMAHAPLIFETEKPEFKNFEFLSVIKPQNPLIFKFDPVSQVIEPVSDQNTSLTGKAVEAVSKIPIWLKQEFKRNLLSLSAELQDKIADLIIQCDDPRYIDEIAFMASHTSPEDMTNSAFVPEIFSRNAEFIYKADEILDFVKLVEFGTAGKDNDFWTTVQLHVKTETSDKWIEIPKEDYYWYVVHLKLDAEEMLFINPASGKASEPPKGQMFREYYLFTPQDAKSYVEHFIFSHPQKIEETEFSGWNFSAHGYFKDMKTGPLELVKTGDGKVVFMEFRIGSGTVIASLMPVEKAYEESKSMILVNMLSYGNGDIIMPKTMKYLVVQDTLPFENDTVANVLQKEKYTYEIHGSAELEGLDLSAFKKIVIPSDQPLSLYQSIEKNREKIETWISSGGVFELHGAVSKDENDWSGLKMPGDFTSESQKDNKSDAVVIGGHPHYMDLIKNTSVFWDEKNYEGMPGERIFNPDSFALDKIGWFSTQNMFDNIEECQKKHPFSPVERAIHAVRIIYNHFGNCGELQDVLTAAARTGLIPIYNVANPLEDHVWNEIPYKDQFLPYQVDWSDGPTRINSPSVSQEKKWGGGKDLSMVAGYRGDGMMFNVTDRYTDTFTLKISLTDKEGRPVDGAMVLFASEGFYPDEQGKYSLGIGYIDYTDKN
jgi:hypothetical protein